MDLFFEVQHHNKHLFIDSKDTMNVLELKKIIEGILKVSTSDQKLYKDGGCRQWDEMDDTKLLSDCGFSSANAKAQQPALVALALKKPGGAFEEIRIDPLSNPPPLPDVMRVAPDTSSAAPSDSHKVETMNA